MSSHEPQAPRVIRDKVLDEDSRIVETAVALLTAMWLGGLILIAIAAQASFGAVGSTLAAPPFHVEFLVKRLGEDAAREILRYQSAEVNRTLFGIWGWVQAGVFSVSFFLLLFFSNLRKKWMLISGGLLLLSLIQALVIIPSVARMGRALRATGLGPSFEAQQAFGRMHAAFGVFEAVSAALALVLLLALLRRGHRARR